MQHGTSNCYVQWKCRCDPCRAAQSEYKKAYNKKHRPNGLDPSYNRERLFRRFGKREYNACPACEISLENTNKVARHFYLSHVDRKSEVPLSFNDKLRKTGNDLWKFLLDIDDAWLAQGVECGICGQIHRPHKHDDVLPLLRSTRKQNGT